MISAEDDDLSIKTAQGEVQIVSAAKQIDKVLWEKAFSACYLDARYYEVVEETLREWFDFRYAILKNERTGKTAVQPFFLVNQEITAGLPGPIRSLISRTPRWLSRRLTVKMVVVGCAAGEGRVDPLEPWVLESLDEALERYAHQTHAGIICFKDFPSHDREVFLTLIRRGYRRLASMPSTRMELGFSSFEEYMQTKMSRGIRSHLRRKFRDSNKLGPLTMEVVNDITPWVDELFSLYLQTHLRSEFRFEQLTKGYFSYLGQRLPERTRFFLWRKEGKLLAFALCMIHGGVLHYLNVGMEYPTALKLHLYYIVWRDMVSWAIDQKLKTIQMGQLNYEAKFRLGFQLAPLDLYVRHTSPVLNRIFAWALPFLEPARYDPALRKFSNADELS
jgi:hypothetical protein